MSGFDDVRLEWSGKEYIIRKDRVLGAIARIEDVVTMAELQRFWDRGTAPMAKIAMAYGAVLRYAGAKVTDDEVYVGMFGSGGTPADSVVTSVTHLIEMMVPKSAREEVEKKKPSAGKSMPAAKNTGLSKNHTKSRLAAGE